MICVVISLNGFQVPNTTLFKIAALFQHGLKKTGALSNKDLPRILLSQSQQVCSFRQIVEQGLGTNNVLAGLQCLSNMSRMQLIRRVNRNGIYILSTQHFRVAEGIGIEAKLLAAQFTLRFIYIT